MTYPAKKDLWLFVLLALVSAGFFMVAVLVVCESFSKHEPGLRVPAATFAAVGVFVLWILLGSSYEITETHLRLQLGPLRWKVPVDTVVEAFSTSRFWGPDFGWGLALSRDRLRIKCRDRWMPFWISPEDKAGFVAELARLNPSLKVIERRSGNGY